MGINMARTYTGYGRRRGSSRRKKNDTQKSIKRNTGARAQSMQIAKLDKRLDRLTKDTIHKIYYKFDAFTDDPGNVYMNQWIIPGSWTKIFNSQASNELQQGC